MDCPKCEAGKTLEILEQKGIEVDRCPGCEGVWLDEYELEYLLDLEEGDLGKLLQGEHSKDADAREACCPRDGKPLKRVHDSRDRGLTLDTCPECKGLWLDGGEFRRIKEAQPNLRLGDFV